MSSDVIVVANGLVVDGNKVYLARNKNKFGDGVEISGSNGGAGTIGKTVAKCNGVNADIIGDTNYPEFPAQLELMNGVWMQNLNAATYYNYTSTRVTMQPLCTLPAGKELTVASQTSNIRFSVGFIEADGIVTYSSGWQSSPLTVGNTNDHDVGCCVNAKFSDDSNITPETAGTVTASVG